MDGNDSKEAVDKYATRKTLLYKIQNQHDDVAWEEFIDIYTRYVYTVIRNMNISEDDTNEIYQRVVLRLWKHLPKMDIEKLYRFRSYLSTTTRNEVLQFIRSRKARINRESESAKSSLNYLDAIRFNDIDTIVENEWKAHVTNLAWKNIEPLFSENTCEVFKLSLEGLPTEEIVNRLGLTINTVNVMKSKVKSRFGSVILVCIASSCKDFAGLAKRLALTVRISNVLGGQNHPPYADCGVSKSVAPWPVIAGARSSD
jgi:RNA polymerase sigma factor (sigma-70 family)